jgi:penicillin-binding protein 1A
VLRSLLRWLSFGIFLGVGVGAVVGLILARGIQLPPVEALTTYRPAAATQVRARDGTLLATFATERRIPLAAEQIPQVFRDAVIAAEDARFYHHTGVDPRGLLRSAVNNLLRKRLSQGGSTLTQQLARTLFLSPEKTFRRKLNEILLAIQIEQRFSKDQIFTLYANQIYFGHGRYGVEAASQFFFGKRAAALTVPEAALLAGIIQRHDLQSPIRYPDRALARRAYVLRQMLETKKIDAATYEAAMKSPLGVAPHYDLDTTSAYFSEEVRRTIEERFGTRQMLGGGLTVETTLDPALQKLAEQSLREGLVELQRRLGWPGARRNVLEEGVSDLAGWRHPSWPHLQWRPGELAYALVTAVEPKLVQLRIGERTARLTESGAAWTGRASLTRLTRRGDVLLVRLGEVAGEPTQPLTVTLEPEPTVEGSLIALDNRTGAILAHVGGFDFERSEWDRAMQATRQCGSAFKPFVYLAAFERGFVPADLIFDGPAFFPDGRGELTYVPLNYYRRYEGIVTLRHALEHSLNASAVKLQQMVSGEATIDMARRLGIKQQLAPYPTLALGTFETTLLELAAAYSGMANMGQFAEPYFIARVRDADGVVLEEHRPTLRQAVRPEVAFLAVHTLEGVIDRGTGVKAAQLPGNLAGKTGTTDAYTDAWFIGFSPRLTCGVWVGRDQKQRIGRNMTGAEAALPTWIRFMQGYLEKQSETVRTEEFPVPAGIVLVPVDRRTGLRATSDCGEFAILEAFPEGREPAECSPRWHAIVALPWQQQLPYYPWRPGEPMTTAESIAAANAKLAAEREN